jgi:hypothetical protein
MRNEWCWVVELEIEDVDGLVCVDWFMGYIWIAVFFFRKLRDLLDDKGLISFILI